MKIGIRPVINGRGRGVRECLEYQTMRMANTAANLISGNLKDRYGNPVEIGGVAEASVCAEKFSRAGVCVTLTVTPCWCYGGETMDGILMGLRTGRGGLSCLPEFWVNL